MHISKIGTVAIALAALAGTSANALTTTQSGYAGVWGSPDSSYNFSFSQFNVAGQILDSVSLDAHVYSQHHAYMEAEEGFYDISDVGRDVTVFYGIDTTTSIGNGYDTNESLLMNNEWGESLASYAWYCNSESCEDGGTMYYRGDFYFNTDYQFSKYIDTGLSHYLGNGQFSADMGQSSVTNYLDLGYCCAYYTTYDYSIYSDVYLTYTFESHDAPIPPGVPEPASWALMISGFGLIGTALRRRREILTA